jgi:hypothetical protein
MSSHHFVKEGQEPALLIAERVSYSLVADLLEWAPLVVVDENMLELVMSWGTKVDVVVAATDLLPEEGEEKATNQRFEVLHVFQQEHYFRRLREYLRKKGHDHLNLAVMDAMVWLQRLDKAGEGASLVIMDERSRWFLVQERFQKWVPRAAEFSLYIPDNHPVSSEGLEFHNARYVAKNDGIVSFSSSKPFWLGQIL